MKPIKPVLRSAFSLGSSRTDDDEVSRISADAEERLEMESDDSVAGDVIHALEELLSALENRLEDVSTICAQQERSRRDICAFFSVPADALDAELRVGLQSARFVGSVEIIIVPVFQRDDAVSSVWIQEYRVDWNVWLESELIKSLLIARKSERKREREITSAVRWVRRGREMRNGMGTLSSLRLHRKTLWSAVARMMMLFSTHVCTMSTPPRPNACAAAPYQSMGLEDDREARSGRAGSVLVTTGQ